VVPLSDYLIVQFIVFFFFFKVGAATLGAMSEAILVFIRAYQLGLIAAPKATFVVRIVAE
jgi:hypothetical protein